MEASPGGYADSDFHVDGFDDDVVGHHVYLMEQAGLITAVETTTNQDPSPTALPLSITWDGHEFLDSVRNETVWRRIKTTIQEKGGCTTACVAVVNENRLRRFSQPATTATVPAIAEARNAHPILGLSRVRCAFRCIFHAP
jgi:uncharacterized protein DUF2513